MAKARQADKPSARAGVADVLSHIYRKYRDDPVFFVEHFLGHKTWSGQRRILDAIARHPRVAVRASHGVSKTYTAGEVATWFYNCFPQSKVITTAPTSRQIRDLLWSEIGNTYRSSRYGLAGKCFTMGIRCERPEHFADGFSSDNAVNIEGYHAPDILWIFDEAKGIPQWVWDSAKGSMTGGNVRWLVISTTDGVNPGEQFYKIFNDPRVGGDWFKLHIQAQETPNCTGELYRGIEIADKARPDRFQYIYKNPVEIGAQLASPQWIKDCQNDWGADSILYITKVLGEICDKTAESIIPLPSVLKMFSNKPADENDGAVEIGVDVARYGNDSTVIVRRDGMAVMPGGITEYTKLSTIETAGKVKKMAGFDKSVRIKVDDTGVGGGVTDALLGDGYNVAGVNFNQDAVAKDKYADAISEMWFTIAEQIEHISCPVNDRLQKELVNRKMKGIDKRGRRMVEGKADYKKRGFPSPDVADAFLLAFYNPVAELRIY